MEKRRYISVPENKKAMEAINRETVIAFDF